MPSRARLTRTLYAIVASILINLGSNTKMTLPTFISAVLAACLMLSTAPVLAKNKNQLPPGLQKKLERGGELPPGWQKKWHKGDRLDDDIYARGTIVVPFGKDGSITVDIEGVLMRVHEHTHEIFDILTSRH